MDAFYASIEQRDRPELRGRPVIVGGTGPRGVVSAASYEARRFGVHSAMPTALARRLCPEGVFLPGDRPRYTRESRRLFGIFRRFTPVLEGLSLDEAFLDLTGSERLLGAPAEVGRELRRVVREETGLAVSVGIAPVKMVAKIASARAKPDGLLEVRPEELRAFLDPLPVGCIWGVGPVAQRRLHRLGIETIGALARAPEDRLRRALGEFGLRVARLARGLDLREVQPLREAFSISEENTFGEDVWAREVLEAALWTHAESVARRLRRSGLQAQTVVLKLKLAGRVAEGPRGHPLRTRRQALGVPTDRGGRIARTAIELLGREALEQPVRFIGVGVTKLQEAQPRQLELLEAGLAAARWARLEGALDALSERFGVGIVRRASQGAVSREGSSLQVKRGEP